jgi:pSer/pThr/pTyr-binding forkhead associated (FHA) protein
MHYIKLSGRTIGLGRGRDSDIRVHDISVSRNHAKLTIESGAVFLVDRESKFGTLVKIQKPVVLGLGSTFGVQCGRTYL